MLAGLVFAALVGVVTLCVWLFSKARKQAEDINKNLIERLEKDRDEWKTKAEDYRQQISDLRVELLKETSELKGHLAAYEKMMARQCPNFQLDLSTHGCIRCTAGMAYGQQLTGN
jgi:hypothetical protein